MAARPSKNSDRFRQRLSSVYASETFSGSRVFQASSAARTLVIASSRLKGGTGGRDVMARLLLSRAGAQGPHPTGGRACPGGSSPSSPPPRVVEPVLPPRVVEPVETTTPGGRACRDHGA